MQRVHTIATVTSSCASVMAVRPESSAKSEVKPSAPPSAPVSGAIDRATVQVRRIVVVDAKKDEKNKTE